ncbi:MAG TPA: nuclear transport factor 2 family protein [Holophagaceae bacterium]|nr:nuclear transport factor 2 family protein [Holophagaceae bacterium]
MLDPGINVALQAFLQACETGDESPLAPHLASEVDSFDGWTGRRHRSPSSLGLVMRRWRERLPGLRCSLAATYGEGPEIVARVELGSPVGDIPSLWAFRFNGAGRVERLGLYLDQGPALEPGCVATLEAYARTFNEDQEDAHMALLSPEVLYFGSVSRMTAVGIPTARGVFRGAREVMGVHRFDLQRVFGRGRDAAVLIRLVRERPVPNEAEGVLVFRFGPAAEVEQISILWNPAGFLARRTP